MCFRPGNVEAPVICSNCNNRVPVVSGFKPKTCPQCGADLAQKEAPPIAVPAAPPATAGAPKLVAPSQVVDHPGGTER